MKFKKFKKFKINEGEEYKIKSGSIIEAKKLIIKGKIIIKND